MGPLLSLAIAMAVPEAAPPAANDGTIVVTATLESLKTAVDRCKRDGCTPRQDIVASIRYAEAVFRSGRSRDARRVLQEAIARDKDAAKSDPLALAALYEATATTARHDGDQAVILSATSARARLLRDTQPPDSPTLFQADLDLADVRLRDGHANDADAKYQALARRAEAARQPGLLAAALMRQAIVAHAQRREKQASALIDRITGDATMPVAYRQAATAVGAGFARERGDTLATDRMIAAFVESGQPGPPLLLWQPPVPKPGDPVNLTNFDRVDSTTRSSDVLGTSWADIGFLIQPDGRVEMPEILRGTPDKGWAGPILTAIAQRRYAAPGNAAGALYRIERWTLTGEYDTPNGSLVRRRIRNPHFEQLDLTPSVPTS